MTLKQSLITFYDIFFIFMLIPRTFTVIIYNLYEQMQLYSNITTRITLQILLNVSLLLHLLQGAYIVCLLNL
jgi:hypothetical protein